MAGTKWMESIRTVYDLPEVNEMIVLLVDCYRKDTLEDI